MPSPATVLLVDPNDDSRVIYSAALRHHGYEVVESSRLGDGPELAAAHLPCLVVVGVPYPQTVAWEAVRALKSRPDTARIPVVAVGSAAAVHDRDDALSLGCAAFLLMPCPPLELLATARGLLQP